MAWQRLSLPCCHHLTSHSLQCFFLPFLDDMEGAGNASGKRVMIFIVPCSCVWEAGDMRELVLSSLFGQAINQNNSIQEIPRAPYRSLTADPAPSCPSWQEWGEKRGQGQPLAAPCSQSSWRVTQSLCLQGGKPSDPTTGLRHQVGLASWSNSAPRMG